MHLSSFMDRRRVGPERRLTGHQRIAKVLVKSFGQEPLKGPLLFSCRVQ